ncbi:MAG: Rod shape-determining protein MreD [Thermoleophilia bacterium]|nr:Rod shape-determining protein MreD [Thermoleophilia bacterium]
MSVTARITGVLIVLFAALLQISVAYRIEVGDAYPDVLILVVASIALLTGSISGATHGFIAGVAIASFAALPLGPHALVGTLVGYSIGRVGEALVTDDHPIPPLLAGVYATLAMQIGRPLVEFLVSPSPGRVDGLLGQAALVTVISSVLAVPVFLLVRKVLVAAHAITPLGVGGEPA